MAHGKAPGTRSQNGVCSTLKAPFGQAASQRQGVGGGQYGHNNGPFDKAQSAGAIPTKFFDGTSPGKARVEQPGGVVKQSSLGTIMTSRKG